MMDPTKDIPRTLGSEATVRHADLPALLGVDRRLLPDVDVVHRTKIKTRSPIAAFDLRRTMTRLGLEVVC